jgi:F-type H+-transporting ATPase subunit b
MTIDISLIFVILNFALLLIILKSLLYKPLMDFLSERQQKVENDVAEANRSMEEASKLVIEKESELKMALEDARQIKDNIRREAELQAENLIHAAKEHERNIISQTQNQIAEQHKQAMTQIESDLLSLIAEVSGKVLSEKIDSQKDKELIHRMLEKRGS